jgi:steroid delta-isomerase-like uncharacterized protein
MSQLIIQSYFDAFNAGDTASMIDLVSDDVVHHVNQGETRVGKAAFAEFCSHMGVSYRERLDDLVILTNDDGTHVAAEFMVHGTYLKTDPGLPEAHGQTYVLPAGSFFSLWDGKITRITTYYNLADWIKQVGG